MTALLGYDDGETIWLAADRRMVSNCNSEDTCSKVAEFGPFTLVLSGCPDLAEFVEDHSATIPPDATPALALRSLRKALTEDGWKDDADSDDDYQTFGINLIGASPAGMFWSGSGIRPVVCATGRFYGMGSGKECVEVAATAVHRCNPEAPIAYCIAEAFAIAAEYHRDMSRSCDVVIIKRPSS